MLKFVTDLFKPSAPKLPPITSEASMNFDAEEVAPFLTQLTNNPRFTFPANLAAEIGGSLPNIEVDDTKRWSITCGFDGGDIAMEIEVFMDDIDAPDLYFFSTQDAVSELDRELVAFSEATGK